MRTVDRWFARSVYVALFAALGWLGYQFVQVMP